MTTFLDTNVLIYLLDSNAELHQWATDQLNVCKLNGPTIVSDMVYCEFAVGMPSKDAVDEAVSRFALERLSSDDAVLWRAASAFARYRAEKGTKTTVLPDFHIGALAEASGAPLMTNDSRDWRRFFPRLVLIKP